MRMARLRYARSFQSSLKVAYLRAIASSTVEGPGAREGRPTARLRAMNACQRTPRRAWGLLATTVTVALSLGTSAADDEPRSATALASSAAQAYAAHEFRRPGELLERAIQRGAKTSIAPYQSACRAGSNAISRMNGRWRWAPAARPT